jgi:hypothetical protein
MGQLRLSAHSKVQHLPLGQALREYEGAANRDRQLSLLLPVQRAAENCAWLRGEQCFSAESAAFSPV